MAIDSSIQDDLLRLIAQARSLQLEKLEKEDTLEIKTNLLPEIRGLLAGVVDLLHQIEEGLATSLEGSGELPPWLASLAQHEDQLRSLWDLCFLARAELRPLEAQTDRLAQTSSSWTCLVHAERAQGAVTRGLMAVEEELSRIAGRPARTAHVDLLSHSLIVRQVTAKFRKSVLEALRNHPKDLQARLRAVGNALVRLMGRDEYRAVSISDRLIARQLRDRTLRWLTAQPSDLIEGRRLWDELFAFAVMLTEVNQRAELLEHDLQVLEEVMPDLAEGTAHDPPSCAAVERLYGIFGRDDRLDTLLAKGADRGRVLGRALALHRSLKGVEDPAAPVLLGNEVAAADHAEHSDCEVHV